MEDKKNETITLVRFVRIVNDGKKHYGPRLTYIGKTDEFYNHLMSQRKELFVAEDFEINNILGITIRKVPNGKLESFYNCSKVDFELNIAGARA